MLLQASERYHRRVLLLIEMTWVIRSPSGAVYLREYEAALHDLLDQYQARAICLYNQTTLLDAQLLLSLHTHQSVFGPDGPRMNPFFVPPEIYRQRDERAQFVHWLNNIHPGAANMPTSTLGVSTPALQPVYDLEAPPLFIAQNSDQGQWKIRCFGQLRVYRESGELVRWQVSRAASRKIKTLFAFLLYRSEAGAAAEELLKDADKLWRFTTTGVAIACDWFKLTPGQYAARLEREIASQLFRPWSRATAAADLAASRAALRCDVLP